MLVFLINLVLTVLALLVAVPAFTGGRVAIRKGGFFTGLIVLLVIGLVNTGMYLGFTLLTLGGVAIVDFLLLGLVGLVINALAFMFTGWLMPHALKVDGFIPALGASLTMTVASIVINLLTSGIAG